MTFEEIKKANEQAKKTDIKGKPYTEVNERIKAFRMVCPDGYIETQIVSLADGICVMRAEVGYYENGQRQILASGTAYEREDSSYINKTSYIENCETSAVGRALGMAGFGIDTSVASYEEVANAILNQGDNAPWDSGQAPSPRPASKRQRELIGDIITKYPERQNEICKHFGIRSLSDLTSEQAFEAIQKRGKFE